MSLGKEAVRVAGAGDDGREDAGDPPGDAAGDPAKDAAGICSFGPVISLVGPTFGGLFVRAGDDVREAAGVDLLDPLAGFVVPTGGGLFLGAGVDGRETSGLDLPDDVAAGFLPLSTISGDLCSQLSTGLGCGRRRTSGGYSDLCFGLWPTCG